MPKWRTFKKDANRKVWTCRGRDHSGTIHTVQGFKDKKLSQDLARQIERIVDCRSQNSILRADLADWVQKLAPRIRDRLAAIGLLDAHTRPLEEHLDAFEAEVRGRGNTDQHTDATVRRIRKILIKKLKAEHWQDVDPGQVMAAITSLKHGTRPISAGTKNDFLRDIKSFARWCVQNGRLLESPIEHLRRLDAGKVRADHRHKRRPLTLEEARKLLEVTDSAPEHHGMTGPDRALLYQLAIETGLRGNELRSLRKQSFDLEASTPTVTVQCAYTKNREEATLPLRRATAERIKDHLANRLPAAPTFSMPRRTELTEMLREDLALAEIPVRDDSGRILNFHALRHTTGSWLAAAGVHPKIIQRILRHSTITLTMDTYTHPFAVDEAAAIQRLPNLNPDHKLLAAATGTAGDPDLRGQNRGHFTRTTTDKHEPNRDVSTLDGRGDAARQVVGKQAIEPIITGKKARLRGGGLEPPLPKEQDPKSCASASSAILAEEGVIIAGGSIRVKEVRIVVTPLPDREISVSCFLSREEGDRVVPARQDTSPP